MLKPNTIHTGDAAAVMATFPAGCIDLVCTSPPYDNLREYNGYTFDFEAIAGQLWLVIKPGGVVVWVVGDATIDGSETGTSFRQALYFMSLGFRLHDTMIYQTDKQPLNHNRYEQKFEYMFVLSKGKPRTWNPLRTPSTYAGEKCAPMKYNRDGSKAEWSGNGIVKDTKLMGNVWYIPSGNGKSTTDNINHPGIFPEKLAQRHILSWSNPGDLVLDPMCGSGTVPKVCVETRRDYIGIDISPEYADLARRRVMFAQPGLPLFEEVLMD